jgi:hypothetical protein
MSNQSIYEPLDEARREIRLIEITSADGDEETSRQPVANKFRPLKMLFDILASPGRNCTLLSQ